MVNNRSTGRARSVRGASYEKELADAFNMWPRCEHKIFIEMLQYFENNLKLDLSQIKKLEATTIIAKLPSGGSPKTDIILKIMMCNGEEISLNISCKRTQAKSVTFHEYSAEEFISVLGITEERLKKLLHKHQTDGSAANFSPDDKEYFSTKIQKYKFALWEWVILGKHKNSPKQSIVDLIITNNKVYLFSDYVDFLKTKKNGFNTGLNWTYQSRGKGRTIQIKGPVLHIDLPLYSM